MKIVQVNAVYGYGSTGLIIRDLEQCILDTGNKVLVAYQRKRGTPINGIKMGNLIDWKMHALLTRVLGKQSYFSYFATKRLIRKLKKESPDIVHLHNVHSNYLHLPSLLKYLGANGIATVITLHDCWFFTGKCTHFVACGCDKWKSMCYDCPQNRSGIKSWFFDVTHNVFEDRIKLMQNIPNLSIVGCSKWITALAKQSPIFYGKNFYQIYNGVDINVFAPKDRNKLRKKHKIENKFVILGMANKWLLNENKSVFQKIIQSLGADEYLMLVGCSDKQVAMLLEYRNVIPIKFITERETLADLYNLADVFVNLTFEDTLPTVNMEALCCGTPVITYDSCGSPELVENSKTGYIIPTLDFSMLRDAMNKVKSCCISREHCAKSGALLFDANKQYQQYISLYEEICSKTMNLDKENTR